MKIVTMNNEDAVKLVNKLLFYFKLVIHERPIILSKSICFPVEQNEYKIFTIELDASKKVKKEFITYINGMNNVEKEEVDSYSTIVLDNGRKFRVNFYETAEELDCFSKFEYSNDVLFCDITERNKNDELKSSMVFAFNLVTMKFSELLELDATNSVGITREANIDEIDEKLYDMSLAESN